MLADNGANASLRAPRGPILVRSFDDTLPHEYRLGDFNPERIILNDPVSRDAAGGPAGALPANAQVRDHFDGAIVAVVDYSFGNYKFLVRQLPGAPGRRTDAGERGAGRASTISPWRPTTSRTSTR